MAKLAPSLVRLRGEVNGRWPRRDKKSDGWLADKRHRRLRSDHNPDGRGIVHAIDIDIDGVDVALLKKELIGDPRGNYFIHNGLIWHRRYGWKPRRYKKDPHKGHIHYSILRSHQAEYDTSVWLGARQALARPVANQLAQRLTRRGDRGPHVAALQRAIGVKPADGIFGPRTEAAFIRWQRANGVKPANGVVGGATLTALRRRRK